MSWYARSWSGPHLGHPEWHWVWLTRGCYHKHGYGPTHAEALANAHAATAHCQGEPQLIANFERRF